MRWDNLGEKLDRARSSARTSVSRTFDTPEFRGITFHEVRARSIVNRVPGASRMPFEWTVNPYRGCTHACVYCFARKTHSYLDLDTGLGFDSQIVVKVNAPELLRRELAARRWHGEHIAMGTNVDCYQRAEGRYRLMPGIIAALRDHANPFSILTKGTLILRDLELLRQAAEVTDVGVSVSVGFLDDELWRTVEPGTPSPERRLDVVRTLTDNGIPLRRADGAGDPLPRRLPGAAARHGPGHRRGRRHVRHPARAASAAGRPRVVHVLARPAPPAPGAAATSGCTRTARTPPSGTSAGSPARSTSSRRSSASAPPGPVRPAASRRRPPPPTPLPRRPS